MTCRRRFLQCTALLGAAPGALLGARAATLPELRLSGPPASVSNPRGAQNAPRAGTGFGRPPVVASYDPDRGTLTWGPDQDLPTSQPDTLAPASMGEESWTWLYLRPLMAARD